MDDLQFRRAIYADPKCNDEAVVNAAKHDPAKQAFWDDLKQIDEAIEQASTIPVPDDLAHKLIMRQNFISQNQHKKRSRVGFAIAASVALVFSLTYSFWQPSSHFDIGHYAMAHVQEEGNGYALKKEGDISIEQVNAQLASLGAQFTSKIGRIYYANFCNFDGIRSFHMVMEGEQGKVTVFVIPDTEQLNMVDNFSNEQLAGQRIQAQHANVVVVADKDKSVEQFKYLLKQNLMFSA